MVGHPTKCKYKHMVSNKLLPNFLITMHNITNANSIFLPGLSGVRVKTVRNKPIKLNTK